MLVLDLGVTEVLKIFTASFFQLQAEPDLESTISVPQNEDLFLRDTVCSLRKTLIFSQN